MHVAIFGKVKLSLLNKLIISTSENFHTLPAPSLSFSDNVLLSVLGKMYWLLEGEKDEFIMTTPMGAEGNFSFFF